MRYVLMFFGVSNAGFALASLAMGNAWQAATNIVVSACCFYTAWTTR